MEIMHRESENSFCPLTDREICQGECYDIQMVRTYAINESILEFTLDRERADRVCNSCVYNQLQGRGEKA